MASLTEAQIDLIAKAMKILRGQAVHGGYTGATDFNDFETLRRNIQASAAQSFLDENLEMTRDALAQVSESLAQAHDAAALVTVAEPSDADVRDFVQKLRAVHEDIQRDQRFRVASELAKSLADTIETAVA